MSRTERVLTAIAICVIVLAAVYVWQGRTP